jgi:hypothetical protein
MNTALRPMSTGEVLDRTFSLYRNNWLLFAGIATLPALMGIIASLVFLGLGITTPGARAVFDPQTLLKVLPLYFLSIFLFYVVGSALATGATVYAVSKVHLGQPVTIRESYGKVFPRLGAILNIVFSIYIRFFGAILLAYGIVAAIVWLLVFGIAAATRGSQVAAGTGIGLVIGVGVLAFLAIVATFTWAIRIYLRYSLSVQACLLERVKAREAMKRSTFLTNKSLGRIFLVYLLMGIIGLTLSYALKLAGVALFVRHVFLATIWQLLASFVASSLAFPIGTIAISLLYYDQRIRKEAFDLQLMMEAVGPLPEAQPAANPIG